MNNLSVVDVSWNTPIGKMRGRIGPYGLEYLGLPLGFKQIPTGDSGPEVPVAVVGTEIRGIQSPGRRQQQCLNLTTQFLEYYFRGDKSCELPELDWSKWGGFYRRVWTETRKVRFGRTRTYGEIAEAAGRPGSARAVGGAMRRNPIVLIIPCHRILGKSLNGQPNLTGFTGSLGLKRQLLMHEGLLSALQF